MKTLAATFSKRKHAVIVSALVIYALFISTIADAVPPVDIEQIKSDWQYRQDKCKSLVFRWSQEVSEREKGIVKEVQEVELRIQGPQFDLRIASPGAGAPDEHPAHRSAYDGTKSQMFTGSDQQGKNSSLMIKSEPYAFLNNYVHVRPVVLSFCPRLSEISNVQLDDYSVLPDSKSIRDTTCIGIRKFAKGDIENTYWLDPARQYLVLRYVSTVAGKDSIRQEMFYSADDQLGWIPDRWNLEFRTGDGDLDQKTESKRLAYTVNQPIEARAFRIEPLKQTQVIDFVKQFDPQTTEVHQQGVLRNNSAE